MRREIREELGLEAETGPLLDVWRYSIAGGGDVLIVTYAMRIASFAGMRRSDEHTEARTFHLDEIAGLELPAGYKASIARARRSGTAPGAT